LEQQNKSDKPTEQKRGPHGRKMGLCLECAPEEGPVEIFAHGLCEKHFHQHWRERRRKAQEVTEAQADKAYNMLRAAFRLLRLPLSLRHQVLTLVKPHLGPIADEIWLAPESPEPARSVGERSEVSGEGPAESAAPTWGSPDPEDPKPNETQEQPPSAEPVDSSAASSCQSAGALSNEVTHKAQKVDLPDAGSLMRMVREGPISAKLARRRANSE
jgi:hypothetical protein